MSKRDVDRWQWLDAEILELLLFAHEQCGLPGVDHTIRKLTKLSEMLKKEESEKSLFDRINKSFNKN